MENNLSVMEMDANSGFITGFGKVSETPKSALSELRMVHNNIMGSKTVDGEEMEVAIIKAGSFSARMPDGEMYYSATATARLFLMKFCYERFDANAIRADGNKGNVIRTVFHSSLNGDLKDNDGTYNCGRGAYMSNEAFKALPESKQQFYRSCKPKSVIFGMCSFDKPMDSNGNAVTLDEFPFKMHVGGNESRENLATMASKLPKDAPMIYNIKLKAVPKKGTAINYAVFQPTVKDKIKDIQDTDDQETMIDFDAWIKDKNQYTMKVWAEKNALKMSEEDADIVGSIVDIEDLE